MTLSSLGGRDTMILDKEMRSGVGNCDDSIDPATKEWLHLATDVHDSEECLAQCKDRFIAEAVEGQASNMDALCEALSRTGEAGKNTAFDWLYCCDSVLCGVAFDRKTRRAGQDRGF